MSAHSVRRTPARRSRISPAATRTISGSIPTIPITSLHASDGGGAVTNNASNPQRTFTSRNYPTGQYYHVVATAHVPYHICGAQQDGSTVCLTSATPGTGAGAAAAAVVDAAVRRRFCLIARAARSPRTSRPIRKTPTHSSPAATTARSSCGRTAARDKRAK